MDSYASILGQMNQDKFMKKADNPGGSEAKVKSHGKWGGFALNTGFEFLMNTHDGDSFGTAAAKSVAAGMLFTTFPVAAWTYTALSAVPEVASAGMDWYRNQKKWYYQQHLPQFGGKYQDTQRALTMRQAAVEAIQGSKLNARSALGGEARILSQGMHRQ